MRTEGFRLDHPDDFPARWWSPDALRLVEHGGPGPHPSGSEQAVHGGGSRLGVAGGRLPDKTKRLGPFGYTDYVGADYGDLETARAAVRENLAGMTWERAYIVNDKGVVEHVIEGDGESVGRGSLTRADVAGKHLLHSHPYNLSISGPDFLSTIVSGQASCEAVLPNGDWWRLDMPKNPVMPTNMQWALIQAAVEDAWQDAAGEANHLTAANAEWMEPAIRAHRYPNARPEKRVQALVAVPIAGAGMALTNLADLYLRGTVYTRWTDARVVYHRGTKDGKLGPMGMSSRFKAKAFEDAMELAEGVEESPEFAKWLIDRN